MGGFCTKNPVNMGPNLTPPKKKKSPEVLVKFVENRVKQIMAKILENEYSLSKS